VNIFDLQSSEFKSELSRSSKLSLKCADEARAAVLSFFDATPDYTVVFTANATAALKLVGESYPFTGGSSFVLGTDSHNSVHGIREYATYRGARVCYIHSTIHGGFDFPTAKVIHLINAFYLLPNFLIFDFTEHLIAQPSQISRNGTQSLRPYRPIQHFE